MTGTVIPAEKLTRLRAIRLAENNVYWQEIVASFGLSGIRMTDGVEVMAGRMLSGEISFEQIIAELKEKHGRDEGSYI